MKEKKMKLEVATPGFEPAAQLPPAKKSAAVDHWVIRPLHL